MRNLSCFSFISSIFFSHSFRIDTKETIWKPEPALERQMGKWAAIHTRVSLNKNPVSSFMLRQAAWSDGVVRLKINLGSWLKWNTNLHTRGSTAVLCSSFTSALACLTLVFYPFFVCLFYFWRVPQLRLIGKWLIRLKTLFTGGWQDGWARLNSWSAAVIGF